MTLNMTRVQHVLFFIHTKSGVVLTNLAKLFGSNFIVIKGGMAPGPTSGRSGTASAIVAHEVSRTAYYGVSHRGSECYDREQRAEVEERFPDAESCIAIFLQQRIGCKLPWFELKSNLTNCASVAEMRKFLDILWQLVLMDEKMIYRTTGCMPDCSRTEYDRRIVLQDIESNPAPDRRGTLTIILSYTSSNFK